MESNQTECLKCGTCCERGGPALHVADAALVIQGVFAPRDLVTLRRGEIARDPASQELRPVDQEIVKVRGVGSSVWRCRFLSDDNTCAIYDRRPEECRNLECWAPESAMEFFMRDLLDRKALCPEGSALRELIETHETAVPADAFIGILGEEGEAARRMAEEMIEADRRFRTHVVQALGVAEEDLDFYFGRSLRELCDQLADGGEAE